MSHEFVLVAIEIASKKSRQKGPPVHVNLLLRDMAPKDTDPATKGLEEKFRGIGLNDRLTAEALKSKLIRTSLEKTIDETPEPVHNNPPMAGLLLSLATATQKGSFENRPKVVKAIIDGRIRSGKQVEGNFHFLSPDLMIAAVEYMKAHPSEIVWVESDFEAASGVGVTVTEGELQDFVTRYISTNKEKIVEERYKALPSTLKELAANPLIKWADPKLRTEVVNTKFAQLLGPKDERDTAPVKKACEHLNGS